MIYDKDTISIIIPTFNFPETFKKVIEALFAQSLLPNEIIVVDSSNNDEISNIINVISKEKKNKIKLIYHKSSKRLYPGEARNKGFEISTCNYISFLDSKTIPNTEWLKENFNLLKNNKLDVVFGKTLYISKINKKQKLIKDLVYGNKPHVTTPGSILHKKTFVKNKFIEGVRTVDDMFWRRYFVSNNYSYSSVMEYNLIYDAVPTSLFAMQKRYFIYSLNLININIQEKTKDVYLALLCILLFLLMPRWNYIYYQFNIEFLYLPHVTKLFFTIFGLFGLCLILIKYFLNLFTKFILTYYTIIFLLFLLSFTIVYNWNYKIADIIFDYSLYIPHITKFYLLLLVAIHFIMRGFYLPFRRRVKLLPFRWITLGIYGMSLDYFKSPGYLIGSIIAFKKLLKK